jgi:hypothetical protein
MPISKHIKRGIYHLNCVDEDSGIVEYLHVGPVSGGVADNFLMEIEECKTLGMPKKIRVDDVVYVKK